MLHHGKISLHRLILSLSDALDFFCPELANHQQRVTYIAFRMGLRMGLKSSDLTDVFLAGALHDIGMIRAEQKLDALRAGDMDEGGWHCETGYELLRGNDLFLRAADIVRQHHRKWDHGRGLESGDQSLPLASQIICLADYVEQSIDRDANILEQSAAIVDKVKERTGSDFHPRCVDAFRSVASNEAFWLDCVSRRIYSLLHNLLMRTVDELPMGTSDQNLEYIAEVFARVVDSISSWTATHTAGVAGTATALSGQMKFSEREQFYMRTAGLLHDLGKLSVPTRILDQRGSLSEKDWLVIKAHTYHTYRILETVGFERQIVEWAAFHHERIDGKGYPFRIRGKDLTLGSRIMAVADSYTALTEDRPYRQAATREQAIAILDRQARHGGLDGKVVEVLVRHLDYIDTVRRQEQTRFAETQQRLAAIVTQDFNPVDPMIR